MTTDERRKKVRSRALRAAKVVSLAASIAMGPACFGSHATESEPDRVADATTPRVDASPPPVADASPPRDARPTPIADARPPAVEDAAVADAAVADAAVADAAVECPPLPSEWTCGCTPMPQECCTADTVTYYNWNPTTGQCCELCPGGPLVPPSVPV